MSVVPFRHPPRQARSRASERRLVAAARALLAERDWDEITVADLTSRAGLAVGAFYARFASKDSLFRHLECLIFAASRGNVARLAAMADAGAPPLALVRALVEGHVRLYREYPEIGRAVVGRSRSDAEARERLRELSRESYAVVAGALERAGVARGADDARLRLEFALYAERSVLREAVLFGEGWGKERRWSDRRLVEETVRLVARHLDLEPPALPSSAAAE